VHGFSVVWLSDNLNDRASNPAPTPEMILVDAIEFPQLSGLLMTAHNGVVAGSSPAGPTILLRATRFAGFATVSGQSCGKILWNWSGP
jgi:hypothetical protein